MYSVTCFASDGQNSFGCLRPLSILHWVFSDSSSAHDNSLELRTLFCWHMTHRDRKTRFRLFSFPTKQSWSFSGVTFKPVRAKKREHNNCLDLLEFYYSIILEISTNAMTLGNYLEVNVAAIPANAKHDEIEANNHKIIISGICKINHPTF